MPTLQIEHGIRDYEAWKSAFDSDPVGATPAASAAIASCAQRTI